MKPTYLPAPAKNKKQWIRELVAEGNYPANEIASIVGSTVEYVWKETSKLRKANLGAEHVVFRSKSPRLNSKDETSIFVRDQDNDLEQSEGNITTATNSSQLKINRSSF